VDDPEGGQASKREEQKRRVGRRRTKRGRGAKASPKTFGREKKKAQKKRKKLVRSGEPTNETWGSGAVEGRQKRKKRELKKDFLGSEAAKTDAGKKLERTGSHLGLRGTSAQTLREIQRRHAKQNGQKKKKKKRTSRSVKSPKSSAASAALGRRASRVAFLYQVGDERKEKRVPAGGEAGSEPVEPKPRARLQQEGKGKRKKCGREVEKGDGRGQKGECTKKTWQG